MIDVALIIDSLPNLLKGLAVSVQITAFAACIGIIFGTFLGMVETFNSRFLSLLVDSYVTLFRGTPMLVQILFFFYVLPQFGIMIAPFLAASLALGLNSSAYVSQIIKTGVNAVSKGQIEAAYTLGFSPIKIVRYILFPQAFRAALPALGNELITLIKDSSLASIIGVMELSKEASLIRSRTYDAFSVLLAISLIYLTMTFMLSLCLKLYERKKCFE